MDLDVDNFWKKDHIWIRQTIYFWWKVHMWTIQTLHFWWKSIYGPHRNTYFGMKPNLKPISQNQIPNLYPGDPIPKPDPRTQTQTYIPNPIPNLYPKKQSQTHIPKLDPKPISQTQTHIPNPIPNLIPNLYPKPNPNPRVFLR